MVVAERYPDFTHSGEEMTHDYYFFWTDIKEIFYYFTQLSNKTQKMLFAQTHQHRTVIDIVTNHASTGLITLLGLSRKLELLLPYVHVEQPQCPFDQYLVGSSESDEFNILTQYNQLQLQKTHTSTNMERINPRLAIKKFLTKTFCI